MQKAQIKFDILLGRSKGTYNSRDNAVTKAVQDQLGTALKNKTQALARAVAEKKVEAIQVAVVEALQQDLFAFARLATAFFFTRGASTAPVMVTPPLTFALKDTIPAMGLKRTVTWNYRRVAQDSPLEWPGLSKSTMKHKRHKGGLAATTYFIYNDVLRQEMASAFGEIIGDLFEPSVTFTTTPGRDAITGRFVKGTSIGKITVRVFRNPSDAGVFRGAIISGDWRAAADDTSMLTRYLSALTAAKLNNYAKTMGGGRESVKRPWVGPSIAYWLIHRMPAVITKSIEGVVKGR